MMHSLQVKLDVRALRCKRYIIFVCAVMTWGWGFLIMSGLQGIMRASLFLLPAIAACPLLIAGILFALKMRRLQGPAIFADRRLLWLYICMVALTLTGYVLARSLSIALHHPLWIIPASTIIVGLHFLGMVPVFKAKSHSYLIAGVFCLSGLIVPLIVPMTFMLGPLMIIVGWQFAIGCICFLWLYGTGIYLLVTGTRILSQVKTTQAQGLAVSASQ